MGFIIRFIIYIFLFISLHDSLISQVMIIIVLIYDAFSSLINSFKSEKAINNSITSSPKSNSTKKPITELALSKLATLDNFTLSENVFGTMDGTRVFGISFDFEHMQTCIYTIYETEEYTKLIIFPISQLISFEVIENGYTITKSITEGSSVSKTATANMLGRAVAGAVLAGGVGAIIGGATAKRNETSHSITNHTSSDLVDQLDIKLLINNTSNPIITVRFIGGAVSKSSELYKSALSSIERCEALIKIMLVRSSSSDSTLQN